MEMIRFNNESLGLNLVVLKDESGVPLFLGRDVANILGYRDAPHALRRHVDDEDKIRFEENRGGRNAHPLNLQPHQILINMSGVFSLILRSKLPTARQFKRWVTSDVLSQIYRTGQYSQSSFQKIRDVRNTVTIDTPEAPRIKIEGKMIHEKLKDPGKQERGRNGGLATQENIRRIKRERDEYFQRNQTQESLVGDIRQKVLDLEIENSVLRQEKLELEKEIIDLKDRLSEIDLEIEEILQ